LDLDWTVGFTMVFIGACVVSALMIANMILARNRGEAFFGISLAMYIVGIVTLLANIVRIYESTTKTILAANAIALLCIFVSMRRCIAQRK